MNQRILIIDDEPVQRRVTEASVSRLGYQVETCDGGEAALDRLAQMQAPKIDAVLLDLVMPDLDGMGVLSRLAERGLDVPVIVQTSQGSIDTVVSAMQAGARDFVVKPASAERLKVSLENALQLSQLGHEVRRIKNRSEGRLGFDDLISESDTMAKVIKLGERAAASSIPVLIEGESGVGKEIVARAIQGTSDRAGKPFITVNCGAIPDNLVESILFGHEKGAFTGANEKHAGKFREAHGGTIFLDEVGELPMDIQVKLLRTLQEGEIDPVGAVKPTKVDFRLISATNRDLIAAVRDGTFREDLYYRLNVFPVRVPPLRERRSDIALLVHHFANRFALEEGLRDIRSVTPAALAMLEAFDWPGNIRQLENAVFRAVVLADGPELTVDEFPQIAAQIGGFSEPANDRKGSQDRSTDRAAESETRSSQNGRHGGGMDANPHASSMYGFVRLSDEHGEIKSMESVERDAIAFALDFHHGHMTRVAKSLGIGRSTLYRKLSEYGLADDAEVEQKQAG
ncbi:MAG: sigma-54 dependent transcriptional regulator [Pseudomonadota bacterium]